MKESILPSKKKLQNKNYRDRFQLFIVSASFSFVSLVFTIINFCANEYAMAFITFLFSTISAITTILVAFAPKTFKVNQIIFTGSILTMFTYFLFWKGTADVFSTYWLLLLPFCAMITLGMTIGTIANALMFIEIIINSVIYYTNPDALQYIHPMASFYLRFPLAYLSSAGIAIIFEKIKSIAFNANEELTQRALDNANTDFLTGLKNRNWLGYFFRDHREPLDTSVGAMMIDIDNFKAANDTYGHIFGDKVLKAIGSVLMEAKCSHAVRWGGDEFVLICENCQPERYKQTAEAIRAKVESLVFENDPQFKLTISIGVAIANPEDMVPIQELIEIADKQASIAKTRGKNCVYIISCGK